MAILLNSGATSFSGIDLTSAAGKFGPGGDTMASYTNNTGYDAELAAFAIISNMNGAAATLYMGVQKISANARLATQTKVDDSRPSQMVVWPRFVLPDTHDISFHVYSTNANDTNVSGDIYIYDVNDVNVRSVLETTPMSTSDVEDAVLDAAKADHNDADSIGEVLNNAATEAKQDIIDAVVDAIKAVTDNLPENGALTVIDGLLDDIKKIAECDHKVDDSDDSQWVKIYLQKGTDTEIMRKNIQDLDGNPVAASGVVIGRLIHTASP